MCWSYFKRIRRRFQVPFWEDRIVIFMKLLLVITLATEKLIFVSWGRYITALINMLFWLYYCYELLWKTRSFQSLLITFSWRSVESTWTHGDNDWVWDMKSVCRANEEKRVVRIEQRKWVSVGKKLLKCLFTFI